jgi:YgiT-type zinc finger domain-containing protein
MDAGLPAKEETMICPICKTGHLTAGKTTVTLSRGNTIVVLKEVPADVCDNCGEYYLTESTADKTFAAAESAVKKGAELEVLRFAA